jgi:hypothetical protein
LSSLQLLLHGIDMVNVDGGKSQNTLKNFGNMELIALHLGIDREEVIGRFGRSLKLRFFHTVCRVGQRLNSTRCTIGN